MPNESRREHAFILRFLDGERQTLMPEQVVTFGLMKNSSTVFFLDEKGADGRTYRHINVGLTIVLNPVPMVEPVSLVPPLEPQ